jgi:hypothetical protein
VQRWLEVLKAGGTRRRWTDADGRHRHDSPQPIHDAVAHVGRLIDELEQSFD